MLGRLTNFCYTQKVQFEESASMGWEGSQVAYLEHFFLERHVPEADAAELRVSRMVYEVTAV